MATILIVDDSPIERKVASEMLRAEEDWTVIEADAGDVAWQRLQIHPVDVLLTDLRMPDLDGLALLERCKQRYPLLPVVVMTGKGSEETAVEALQKGADGYITKRALTRQLCSTLASVLAKARRQYDDADLLRLITSQHTTFCLDCDRRRVPVLIGRILDTCRAFHTLDEREHVRVGVALEEALLNAIIHGNLEVSSHLREEEGEAFEKLIRLRMKHEYFSRRRVHVTVTMDSREFAVVIRDEGPGFDVAGLPDPTDAERIDLVSGRGILLMRAFMDHVQYNSSGNEVTLVKRRPDVLSCGLELSHFARDPAGTP